MLLVTLSYVCDMDAARRVSRLLQGGVGGDASFSRLTDQDILRIHTVRHRSVHLIVVVSQLYGDLHRLFGEGDEKHVLERFLRMFGLLCGEPLLEQRGERMAEDHQTVAQVAYDQLSVSLQRHLGKAFPFAVPTRQGHEFVHIQFLMLTVT